MPATNEIRIGKESKFEWEKQRVTVVGDDRHHSNRATVRSLNCPSVVVAVNKIIDLQHRLRIEPIHDRESQRQIVQIDVRLRQFRQSHSGAEWSRRREREGRLGQLAVCCEALRGDDTADRQHA